MKKLSTTKMCCGLQTHTKVIAIINLIGIGLGATKVVSHVRFAFETNISEAKALAIVNVLSNAFWAVAVILCLVGAIKRKRFFLIPFMVGQSISILICSIACLLIMILGSTVIAWVSGGDSESTGEIQGGEVVGMLVVIVLIFFGATIGVSVYFLLIVAKFYKECRFTETSYGQPQGMVLEPTGTNEGSKMYVPPDSQKLTLA